MRASGGRRRWCALSITAAAAAGTLLSGCTDPAQSGPAATAAPPVDTESSVTAPPAPTVDWAETDLGPVLVDGRGFTLYRFTPDRAGSSTCLDGCADAWPPATPDGALRVADGLDPTQFGTFTRADGRVQVTIEGLPLYLFAGDTEAGQRNGHGVADMWFVVEPDGSVVTQAPGA